MISAEKINLHRKVFSPTSSYSKIVPYFYSAVYQNSGDENTNWGDFEKKRNIILQPNIANGDKCGVSCDFWGLYDQDIERAHSLGSNCFRLSLEWGRLQPDGPGTHLDRAAVQRYHAILDSLAARNMEPFLTLHHFVHPLWFEKLRGFEKEENIKYFVEYAILAFKEYGQRTRFWATFNEPGVTSYAGCIYGGFPPGHLGRFSLCGRQILHMLRSHTEAYEALKALPGGKAASIGLVHNWTWFEPKKACCVPFYVKFITNLLNRVWANEAIMTYLKTGVYDYNPLWYVPLVCVLPLLCLHHLRLRF